MSLRAEELIAYLDLDAVCSDMMKELSELYEEVCLARGKESLDLQKVFDAKLFKYKELSARKDTMRRKLFREDPEGAAASLAAAHLGSLSRRNPTEAQQRASRENGKKGGRR
jgi:hypothetical protein